jgi:hypothetical protein
VSAPFTREQVERVLRLTAVDCGVDGQRLWIAARHSLDEVGLTYEHRTQAHIIAVNYLLVWQCVQRETETAATVRNAALEEAARACEMVAKEAMVLSREDGVPADSIRGVATHGYINGAAFSAAAIRALKTAPAHDSGPGGRAPVVADAAPVSDPEPAGEGPEAGTISDPPRCQTCGYWMCQQFDYRRINDFATLGKPNGKFRCWHCQPMTAEEAKEQDR